MHDIVDKFSTHLKNVLTRALCLVVERNQTTIEPIHLLWALGTQKGCIGAEILKKVGVKQTALRQLIGGVSSKTTSSMTPVSDTTTLQLSDQAKRIVEKAVLSASTREHRYVGTEHLLEGMVNIRPPELEHFFSACDVNVENLETQISIVLKSTSRFPDLTDAVVTDTRSKTSNIEKNDDKKLQALEYFARELTTPEEQTRIDPVIARETEIERLMEILCRRNKNNPLLLGEPGVGKTAIVEGLAKRIMNGDVPNVLLGKRIFAIDMAMMVAGTMYRGEFEGRLKQILEEVRASEDVIVFIDEIHMIIGAGSSAGSMDAANILKPSLARGDIRCIGATTQGEYKKHMESDGALERRFQTIVVEEPDREVTVKILRGIATSYEAYHHVTFGLNIIERAVDLSNRYIHNKHQPDKAIDLLDETAASVRVKRKINGPSETRRSLERELKEVREQKYKAVMEERYEDAFALKEQEDERRRVLASAVQTTQDETRTPVTEKELMETLSKMTGVPLSDLMKKDKAHLSGLEQALSTQVIGQPQAVRVVANALQIARSGLAHPRRPMCSLLFLGPSGVGKTELARAVARECFHSQKALIRLDMSEYAESYAVSKLIGSPPGYVGYREISNLTDRIKQKPHAIVLFDELEKAHPDVQNLLLQILEEGELTDATGQTVNFRNAIIVMTSNVGLERFERGSFGFIDSDQTRTMELDNDLRDELERRFRPELINRVDHVCLFEPLSDKTYERIFHKHVLELVERISARDIHLTIDEEVIRHLCKDVDKKLGGRAIRQIVQKNIETKIAQRLLKSDSPKRLKVSLKNGGVHVTKTRT